MMFFNLKLSIASATLLTSLAALALPSDQRQTINVEADRAQFNQRKGEINYSGHVTVKQGTITIQAEELSIYTNPETGEFKSLTAKGSPSKFSQQIDQSGRMMRANGNILDYDVTLGELKIQKNGYLKRGEDEISAEYIHYQLNNSTFQAENRGSGRVNMTLQPTAID